MNGKPNKTNDLKQAVEIIYAGGTSTISATPEGYIASGRAFNLIGMLEEYYPDFKPDFDFGRKQVAYTGLSENIMPTTWEIIDAKISIALSRNPRGVLITHGTDTMEQLVRHLRSKFIRQLKASGQKLIVTGANQGIEEPETDAWKNLMFALENAASDAPADIYVSFHGKLIPAQEVVKLPYTPGTIQTFVSIYDPDYKIALAKQQKTATNLIAKLVTSYQREPDESIAVLYDVNVIRYDHQEFLDWLASKPRAQAVLFKLYRCGTANTEKSGQSVADLVHYLRNEKGLVCYAVTESGDPVNLQAYETSVRLRKAGLVPLYNLLGAVAATKLRLLSTDLSAIDQINEMLTNKVGEIDETTINKADIDDLKKLYKK